MNRIPVGETIGFALNFLFGEFRTVLRLSWLPALLAVGVDYLSRRYALDYAPAMDPAAMATGLVGLAVTMGSLFVTLLTSSIIMVGITRAAMGLPVERSPLHFPLGQAEWRMLGVYIIYVFAILALMFILVLFVALALMLAGVRFDQPLEAQGANPPVLVVTLIGFAGLIYVFVNVLRMGFLLAAVVVAEEKGSIARAHALLKGNVWRAFLVMLALTAFLCIPLVAAQFGIVYAALGSDAFAPDSDLALNLEAAAAAQPILWGLFFFVATILASGLIYPAAAFAYLKITEPMPQRAAFETTPPPSI
jgi:hypothetical protein